MTDSVPLFSLHVIKANLTIHFNQPTCHDFRQIDENFTLKFNPCLRNSENKVCKGRGHGRVNLLLSYLIIKDEIYFILSLIFTSHALWNNRILQILLMNGKINKLREK